jgi:hypothetical protein
MPALSQEKTVITVDVKPDLSRFVQATLGEVEQVCAEAGAEHPLDAIQVIMDKYILLPR